MKAQNRLNPKKEVFEDFWLKSDGNVEKCLEINHQPLQGKQQTAPKQRGTIHLISQHQEGTRLWKNEGRFAGPNADAAILRFIALLVKKWHKRGWGA